MSRDLNRATPRLKAFAEKLIAEVKRILGIDIFPVDVDRPFDVQVAYYAQGREPLDITNRLRKRAGLAPIGESENKKKITWTMDSRHIVNLSNDDVTDDYSHAID
jgi:peptidoglycan L-alanyl-D-glutamate endopeptidase CwlK